MMQAWADGMLSLSVQMTCSRGVPQAATSCHQPGPSWWDPRPPPGLGCQPASIAHPGRGTGTSMPVRCQHARRHLCGMRGDCRCHHGKQQLQRMLGCIRRHRIGRQLPGRGGSMVDSTWRSPIGVTAAGSSSQLAGSPLQAWSSSGRAVASSGLLKVPSLNTTSLGRLEPRRPLQLLVCTTAAGSLTGGWLQLTQQGLAGSLLLAVRQALIRLVARSSSRGMLAPRCPLCSWAKYTVRLPPGRSAAARQQALEGFHSIAWLASGSGSSKATLPQSSLLVTQPPACWTAADLEGCRGILGLEAKRLRFLCRCRWCRRLPSSSSSLLLLKPRCRQLPYPACCFLGRLGKSQTRTTTL